MKESGKVVLEMDLVFKYGQMGLAMKVNGDIIGLMVKANLFMQMEMYMKVNGLMTKLMELEHINIRTVPLTKGSGKTTSSTAKVQKNGTMEVYTMVNILKANKHGFGIYIWNDKSKFVGQWYENKISGIGIYSWLDGRMYKGEWKDNNMEGYGVYQWKDGRKYEGQYREDK